MIWKQFKLRNTNVNVISHIFSSKISKKTSYNPSHINLGYMVQQPYCNKTLCSFPPSVEFFASVMHANPQKPTLSIEQLM